MTTSSKVKKKRKTKKRLSNRKAGPQPYYTKPEVLENILENKRRGMSDLFSFREAGLSDQSFYVWKDMFEAENCPEELKTFFGKLKQADARGQKRALDLVWKAAEENNWQAAFRILERRWPKDFAPPEKKEDDKEQAIQVIVNLPDNGRYKS